MVIIEMLYYATLVLCFFLILDVVLTILNTKFKLEWKIAKITNTIFLALLFLSVNRLLGKLPNNNLYDYLLVIFNGGLFIVGSIVSKNIMKD
ncbi:hypothetical protein [Proteiniborus sp. MB09-C3]|uniref:hypothetical protein n=1 Tax=Proteiniborus sp. MB09-C3 TaxID=3050072 RepID=UPI002555C334|nr:hypothetical protein [Proteiniborus sp. MB09-C3]WIV10651.1 hypothetical protein QO263_10830 [Proteiniborus sp. MB09-C3]